MFVAHALQMLPFKNILIPVNFFNQPSIAAEKALEFYEPSYTIIHIVHVLPNTLMQYMLRSILPNAVVTKKEAQNKLEEIQEDLLNNCNGNIVITKVISEGNAVNTLTNYIQQHTIDLVIVCNETKGGIINLLTGLNTAALTKQSGCPVLVITPACLNHPIKTILINVSSFIPEKKIQVAMEFARRYRAHIYLVTILDNMDANKKTYSDAFYKTYKMLKDYGHEPDYKVLTGDDSTESLLRHAQSVKADMILLNPAIQKTTLRFMGNGIAGLINPLSALHVLMLGNYRLKN